MSNSLDGRIVSLKMKDTIVVEVARLTKHPLYKKRIRRTKNYMVHYEGSDLKEGDTVTIRQCRPLSKNKHFKIMVERKENK